MLTLYGIPNCDTVRKARRWLTDHHIEHVFHDFRKDGLEPQQLHHWATELGWETLLNKRGLTWKRLDQKIRDSIDQHSVLTLMLEQPAMIKRPVLDVGNKRIVGFKDDLYTELFTP